MISIHRLNDARDILLHEINRADENDGYCDVGDLAEAAQIIDSVIRYMHDAESPLSSGSPAYDNKENK